MWPSTDRKSSLLLTDPAHGGLQPCKRGQHSRTRSRRILERICDFFYPFFILFFFNYYYYSPSDRAANKERCSDGPRAHQQSGLAGNGEVKGSLGCREREMVEFRILKAGRRVKSKHVTNPGLQESRIWPLQGAEFGLFKEAQEFKNLASSAWKNPILWDKALQRRGPKKAG